MENYSIDLTVNRIGFVGNYLPRQYGIATFTTALCKAIAGEYEGTTKAGTKTHSKRTLN